MNGIYFCGIYFFCYISCDPYTVNSCIWVYVGVCVSPVLWRLRVFLPLAIISLFPRRWLQGLKLCCFNGMCNTLCHTVSYARHMGVLCILPFINHHFLCTPPPPQKHRQRFFLCFNDLKFYGIFVQYKFYARTKQ